MDKEIGSTSKITMQAWATPKLKWYNLFPFKFNNRKRDQLQTFIEYLEKEGYQVIEQCSTPFVTAIKIAENG